MTFRSALPRNTVPTLVPWPGTALRVARRPRGLRRRARARRRVVPAGDGLERRRGARPGRGVRGAPPDAEGSRDRADDRSPARRRRLPAPHGAGARRAAAIGARFACRFAAKCEIEIEEHASAVVFGGGATGSRPRTTESPRRGARRRALVSRDRRRRARAPAHQRRHAALRARDRRPRPSRRGRARRAARSTSRRAATRARSPSRGSTTAAASTARCACSRSRATSCPSTTPS